MLTLRNLDARAASPNRSSGLWYELAPGPDTGQHWSAGSAFYWYDEWESVAEPILANRLQRYDRHSRVELFPEDWDGPLYYLDDVCARLRQADEPALVYVATPELPAQLLHGLARQFPRQRDQLIDDLEQLAAWCRAALLQQRCITLIGL